MCPVKSIPRLGGGDARVDNEMLNTALQHRDTRMQPITQGVHVPQHSTVNSIACSIMPVIRCAHKQERRSGGDRRLLNLPQWVISNTHNDHVHWHTF